jgi:hypothetical protein
MRGQEHQSLRGPNSAQLERAQAAKSVASISLINLATFAAVPEPQNEDHAVGDLVAHLIVADDDPADLSRLVGFKLLADPRKLEQFVGRLCELLNDSRCGVWRDRF